MDYREYNDYELLYMVKENKEVLNIILEKYNPLISNSARKIANLFHDYYLDCDDLKQEGIVALFQACYSFDCNSNTTFYTFALLCIKRAMLNYIRNNCKSDKQKTLTLASSINTFSEDIDIYCDEQPLSFTINYEITVLIKEFSYDLEFSDMAVFNLKLNGFTYKEIASLLNYSVKYVDNRLFMINKKLKRYLLDKDYCL